MHASPPRASPVVGAITTLVERWVSQDAALVNAAQAATRLQHLRREHDDVTRFLAAHERRRKPDDAGSTTGNLGRGHQTSSGPP